MSMFSRLFGERHNKAMPGATSSRSAAQYAPGTEIAYDEELITRFEGHHQSLLKLFNKVTAAANEEDYDRLGPALKKFLNVFDQHILEENLKLYVYLEKCIDDEDHVDMMHDMKQEMGQIGRTVRAFVKHHLQFGVNDANIGKFRQELAGIGEALSDRIEREEDGLYKLYVPPRNYQAMAT